MATDIRSKKPVPAKPWKKLISAEKRYTLRCIFISMRLRENRAGSEGFTQPLSDRIAPLRRLISSIFTCFLRLALLRHLVLSGE